MVDDNASGRGGDVVTGDMAGCCFLCQEALNHHHHHHQGRNPLREETALSLKNLFQYLQVDVGKLKLLGYLESTAGSGLMTGNWDEGIINIASTICEECANFSNLFGQIYEDYEKAVRFMNQCIQRLERRMTNKVHAPDTTTAAPPRRGGGGLWSSLKAEVLRKCQLKLEPTSTAEDNNNIVPQLTQENQSLENHLSQDQQDHDDQLLLLDGVIPDANSNLDRNYYCTEIMGHEERTTETAIMPSSSKGLAMSCPPPPPQLSPAPAIDTFVNVDGNGNCTHCGISLWGPKSRKKKHMLLCTGLGLTTMNDLEKCLPQGSQAEHEPPVLDHQLNGFEEDDFQQQGEGRRHRQSDNNHDTQEAAEQEDAIQKDAADESESPQVYQGDDEDDRSGRSMSLENEIDGPPAPRLEVATHTCGYCDLPLRGSPANLTRHMVNNHTTAYFQETGNYFVGWTDEVVELVIWDIIQEGLLPDDPEKQDTFHCSFCEGGGGGEGVAITGGRKFHLLTKHVALVESRLGGSGERGWAGVPPNMESTLPPTTSTQVVSVGQESGDVEMAAAAAAIPSPPEVMVVAEVEAGPSTSLTKEIRDHQIVNSHFLKNRLYYKAKNVEPPYTTAFLIRKAIRESPENQLSTSGIVDWLLANFTYFQKRAMLHGGGRRIRKTITNMLATKKGFINRLGSNKRGKEGAVWGVRDREFFQPGTKWSRKMPNPDDDDEMSNSSTVMNTGIMTVKRENLEEGEDPTSLDSIVEEEVVPPPTEIQDDMVANNNQTNEQGVSSSSSNNTYFVDESPRPPSELLRYLKLERVERMEEEVDEPEQEKSNSTSSSASSVLPSACELELSAFSAPPTSTMYLEHLKAKKEEFNRVRHLLRTTNQRPEFTFEFLISQALNESDDKTLELSQICNWFMENFRYYRRRGGSGQANLKKRLGRILSSYKSFVRVEDAAGGRQGGGGGAVWRVNPREFYKPRSSASIAMKFKPNGTKRKRFVCVNQYPIRY